MDKFETETIPVSCMNAFKEMPQTNLRYGHVWPTDPVLYEINAKLDKILALLDKDD